MKKNIKNLYPFIINNKFITICILFTILTILETLSVLFGIVSAKDTTSQYLNVLGRLFYLVIFFVSINMYDKLKQKVRSNILRFFLVLILSWAVLMLYIVINSFIVTLEPNAFLLASRNYIMMYLLFALSILVHNFSKKSSNKKSSND